MDTIEYSAVKPLEKATVLIATKTFYFGLGGGLYEFEEYLKKNYPQWKIKIIQRINDGQSIERMILQLEYSNQDSTQEEAMEVDPT